MLDLLRSWYESGDEQHGDYTRAQLEVMNSAFVERVEAAFQAGLESRAGAAASYVTRKSNRRLEEAVIQAAWDWLWREEGDLPFVEIVKFVRVRCPQICAAVVQAAFERRFRQSVPK